MLLYEPVLKVLKQNNLFNTRTSRVVELELESQGVRGFWVESESDS